MRPGYRLGRARQLLQNFTIGSRAHDEAALEFLGGRGERVDELEQLHHSLTPEQRERLRQPSAA
jgi:hypothetical protein